VPTFDEAIEVRVVNVEAVVVDDDGQPVRGLARSDFRLLVDGEVVAIDHFDEVAVESAPAAAPAVTATAESTVRTPAARSLLVLVDDSFAVKAPRNAALRAVGRELSVLAPGDRVAIVAFNGRRLDTLAPWTSDRKALAAALAAASKRPAQGNQLIAEDRGMQADVDLTIEAAAEAGLSADEIGSIVATMGKRVNPAAAAQLGRTTEALAGALRGFEAPPGRKVLVLMTGGWSTRVAPQLFGPLVESANRLGYTIYPVDVAVSEAAATKALDALARATGGRATTVSGKLLTQITTDSGSYYWLGFNAGFRGDDSVHQVAVEVLRPGLRVRSRSSYSDLSARTETAMRAEGVTLFGGAPEDRRLVVQVEGTKEVAKKKREVEVAVTLGVPVDALAFTNTAEGGGLQAEVPLAILALDRRGGRSEVASRLRVAIPGAPPTHGLARFRTTVKLRRVSQRVVFTVQAADGRYLWGETELSF
jgi:VWFA-related protein